jgi:hypothetical protein
MLSDVQNVIEVANFATFVAICAIFPLNCMEARREDAAEMTHIQRNARSMPPLCHLCIKAVARGKVSSYKHEADQLAASTTIRIDVVVHVTVVIPIFVSSSQNSNSHTSFGEVDE